MILYGFHMVSNRFFGRLAANMVPTWAHLRAKLGPAGRLLDPTWGSTGHSKISGGTEESRKNMIFEKTGDSRNSGVHRNCELSCYPGKRDIQKIRGYREESRKDMIFDKKSTSEKSGGIRTFPDIRNFHVIQENRHSKISAAYS